MASTPTAADDAAVADWEEVQASPEFGRLRHALRSFVFPMTIAFLLLVPAVRADGRLRPRTSWTPRCSATSTSALIFGLLQFVSTFTIAICLRPLREPQDRPACRRPARRDRGRRRDERRHAVCRCRRGRERPRHQTLTIVLFGVFVAATLGITIWASRGRTRPRPTTTPAAARSRAGRTAWRSAATTCRPRRSSASPASSRSTATTASSTRIGFLVAWLVALLLVAELMRNTGKFTMADVLCVPDAAAARCAPRRRCPPSWCRSSTCSPRWSAPARWCRCCSASHSRGART